MILTARPADYKPGWKFGAIVLLLVLAALMIRGGSPLLIGALVALLLAPFALFFAATRPVIFPYGLYVLLVPFDNLLGAGSFGTLTKFLGALCALLLFLWCVRYRSAVSLPSTVLPLFAFLFWIAASSFWALDQNAALDSLPTFAGLTILYVALAIAPITEKQYRTLLFLVLAAGVISAGYGAVAFYRDPMLAQSAVSKGRLVLHIANVYVDPNHFADALLLPASAAIMLGLRAATISRKLPYVAALCVMAMAIALSGSRGALISLAVIVVYFVIRSRHRVQVAILCGVLASAMVATGTSMWVRLSSALATGGSGRTSVWSVGLETFKHRWLAGYGIGNFPAAYDAYYIQVYQSYSNGWTSGPHNVLIRYLVETGIIGALLVGWFFWEHFRCLRIIERHHPLYDFRIMSEAALIGLIVGAMTLDLFHYKYLWLLLALTVQLRAAAMHSAIVLTPRPRSQLART